MTGMFGEYGGQFVPETLVGPLDQVEAEYQAAKQDPAYQAEIDDLLRGFVGRSTPITRLRRLHREREATVWLKREDLIHTGAHKINNVIGQALLAQRMGKRRIIAETGAGQHGVAVAAVCAHLGLDCTIFQGSVDAKRQEPNLQRMRLLGANVVLVDAGSATLKDAVSEAIRDWLAHPADTHYLLGSVIGPHPYPTIVRDFQSVIGREARAQILAEIGRLPDAVVACVGGGSNSLGIFSAFLDDPVPLYGVQAAGEGTTWLGRHAAPLLYGEPGVLHGTRTDLIQDEDGQIQPTHSIAPGLDYAGAGPEHCHLRDLGRVSYLVVTDAQALDAFAALSATEGIIPALESAHAIAALPTILADLPADAQVLVNLSGRGDKDLSSAFEALAARKDGEPHVQDR
ncbi:tryptophan synthase subunit beta [Saccharopolyspora phatthalungensis]|uniref:Tryptophan synthase beta chain n=1 Tax=Saccharopolyspora phatthalungensis TaxID=664693 RepID=A0A840QBP3_9PSEU|nr:tryptophan synthase subunit beta [Saccharopolyspora phatthalungensis]MBB5157221.1 tryptophan synthase beta chain [Saccharopolyspora phatthalungensis]